MRLKSCLLKIVKYKNFKEILGIIIGLAIFTACAVTVAVNKGGIPSIDIAVRDFAYNIRGEKYGVGYWFFRIVTEFGFVFIIIFIFFVFAFFTRIDLRCLFLGAGSIVNYLCNELVKTIYQRPRPIEEMRWMVEKSTSFPSGHSMTATYFYVILAYFCYRSCRPDTKTRFWILFFSYLTIFLVGFSRIILGVHYFTDVIGGFSLGFSLAMLSIIVYKYFNDKGYKFLSKYLAKGPHVTK